MRKETEKHPWAKDLLTENHLIELNKRWHQGAAGEPLNLSSLLAPGPQHSQLMNAWSCLPLVLHSGCEAVLEGQLGGTKELVLQCQEGTEERGLKEDESLQVTPFSPSYKVH